MNAEQDCNFDITMSPPIYREKINIDKALDIILQSQQIILSKNIAEIQTKVMIDICFTLIEFVEKDHYQTSDLLKLFGRDKQ